jgi:Polyketide cyclase / dehydrase and lipid transport
MPQDSHRRRRPPTAPQPSGTRRSITKTVRIDRDVATVFAFLADPANWPRWAVVNVEATWPTADPAWWAMQTPHGQARLRIRAEARYGILDHDFVDPQASWTVPARVVPNGDGSEFMMTFVQPPSFDDTFFDDQIKLVDTELAKLKDVLESAWHRPASPARVAHGLGATADGPITGRGGTPIRGGDAAWPSSTGWTKGPRL